MIEQLWRWDTEAFRALHGLSASEPVAALVRILCDSGLGHIQLLAVPVVVASRRWPRWAGVLLVLAWAIGCWAVERDWTAAAACALCLGLFRPIDSRALGRGALCAVAAGLLRLGVEPLFDRLRPSNLPFANPLEPVFGASSFPSGHATSTGALAMGILLARRWGPESWLIVSWGVLVAASRVAAGVHFPSDVVGGLGLGAAVAALLAAYQGRAETAAKS